MAEQRQLIYKILLEAGNSSKDAKKLAAEIDKVTNSANAAAAANEKMGEAVGKNSEVIFGSINHLKNQISGLKQQRDAVAVGGQEFTKYNNKIATLESQLKQASAATDIFNKSQKEASVQTKELAKLQENQGRSAGLAGAAAFELGRTISDLPFGLVAISNNVSQLGTLFAALVANAGGFSKALKLVKQQLAGPAGILIAFQVVIAAITFFKMVLDRAERSVNALAEAQAAAATNLKALRDAIELQTVSLTQAEEMISRANKEYEGLNLQVKDNLELTTDSKTALDDLILSFEKAAKAKAALTLVEQLYQEQIEKEIFLEKLRTDGFEGFTAIYQGFLTGLAGGIVMPELGKQLRIDAAEASLRNVNDRIKEVLTTVGTEGLADKIFGPEKDSDKGRAERAFFPFLSDDQLKNLEKNIDNIRNKISSLIDAQIQEQESVADEAILESNERKFATHYHRLNELKRLQLQRQKEDELAGVRDPAIVNAIEAKYSILFRELNREFKDSFEKGINEIFVKFKAENVLGTQDKISLLDLLDGPEKTEAQKWAKKELKKVGDAITKEFQKRVAETPALNGEGDGAFDFLSTFGISEQRISEIIDVAQQGLATIGDIFASQAERDVTIETNKTNAINDQLKIRLANEQMSADERDKINQQIARNQAQLVIKENAINKKRFDQEKAVNIATAVMNTFAAATGVLKDTKGGTFARIAGMIAVITAGLANVAMISRQQFQSRAMPNPRLMGLGESESGGPSFNVVGASSQNQLAQVIAAQNATPIKTFVVSSDVSSAQELERKIIEGASI